MGWGPGALEETLEQRCFYVLKTGSECEKYQKLSVVFFSREAKKREGI